MKQRARAETGTRKPEQDTANRKRDALDLAARVAPNGAAQQIAYLRQAKAQYQAFIDRAKNRPDMRQAVVRSRERIDDIDKTIQFLEGTDGAAASQR